MEIDEIVYAEDGYVGELKNMVARYLVDPRQFVCIEDTESGRLAETTGKLVCITDMDHVIAAAGNGKKAYENQPITGELESLIAGRQDYHAKKAEDVIPLVDKAQTEYAEQAIAVVNVHGDIMGAVVLLGQDEISSLEITLVRTTAEFLGSIMED